MDSNWKYLPFLKSKKIFFDMKAIFFFLFFVVKLNYNTRAQENCGNGIDDDSDGLIDCFDPDCAGNPPSSSFFNTANNGLGGVLPGGSQDLSWKVSSSFAGPFTPAYVMSSIPGVYYSSPWPNSKWISYTSTGFHSVSGGPVDYYFKISFLLPCYNPCGLSYSTKGTFCLTLDYFADNSIYEIWVNGVPQSSIIGTIPVANPYYNLGYNSTGMLTASLCQNWHPGLNEIIVRLSSGPDYIGLLVQSSINTLPVPTASISGTTTVCQNDPAQNIIFTGSGTAPFTFTYNINNGVNQTIISNGNTVFVQAPTNIAGTFTYSLLSVQDANSIACPNALNDNAIVIVNPIPLTDAGNNQTICSGTSTSLTASGGTSYQWFGGPASDEFTVSPVSTTIYSVTAYLNGCSASDDITITVNPVLTQNVSVSICQGNAYQLPSGILVNNAGVYHDTIPTSQGCDSIFVISLSVFPQILVSVATRNISCYGGNDGSVQLFPLGGSAPFTFQLLGFGNNSIGIFNNLSAGSYSYTITDNYGCKVSGNCIVNQPNKIKITVHPSDTTIDANDIVNLVASCNYPNATYAWSPNTFLSCDTCLTTSSSPDINITYHLVVSVSINGVACYEDTNSIIHIKTNIYTPNSFTPNGDGVNDNFQIEGINLENNFSSFHIQIFNRWGQLICDYDNPNIQNFKWDGTFRGREQQIGVYVYIIKYRVKNKIVDEEPITGSINLLR